MRKDYINTDTGDSEIAFVERYWTDVWKREGGPKGVTNKIPNKPEYRIMQPYIETLPGGAAILDGGCGLGDWTAYLSELGYSALGLDISRETIEQLTSLFPDYQFAVGDIRNTELSDESFDGYFSWGTFEHFENGLGECINEAYRVLKPGGYLFISVPFDNVRQALYAACAGAGRSTPVKIDRRFYQWRLTRSELRGMLNDGGFEVLQIPAIHKRQGVLRSLHHEFRLPYDWLLTKGLATVLAPFIPGGLVAHMIMAVARKP